MTSTDFGIQFDRPRDQRGFDIIPRVVTLDRNLSDGAYRTYVVLSMFAWWKEASMTEDGDRWCYPGQAKVAEMRGQNVRSIIRHIQELETCGWLAKERRGQGKTNRYTIITTGLTLVVQGSRSDTFVTSGRSDTNVTSLKDKNKQSGVGAAAEGGEPALGQAISSDKLTAALNVFRDLHFQHQHRKYLVEWARDKAAMKKVLATYATDTLRGMISIYLTTPRKKYTVVGFAATVPELIVLLEQWLKKQARKKMLAGEVETIKRLQTAFEAEATDAGTGLADLDKKLSGLTEGHGIPDIETREAIDTVVAEIAAMWHSIFKRACYNAPVPEALQVELLQQIGDNWDDVRTVMENAIRTRQE